MPPGKVGHRFTALLATEWQGVIDWKWNSKRPLVFSHVVLTRALRAHKAKGIRASIDRQLDLWERGIPAVLTGDVLAEGRDRKFQVTRIDKE